MIISAIIEILIGLVVWQIVPGWITQGSKNMRDIIKLACNIIGVVIVLVGCISLIRALIVSI